MLQRLSLITQWTAVFLQITNVVLHDQYIEQGETQMDLYMDTALIGRYRSNSQIARVITEQWVSDNMFCPRCGNASIMHFENNKPVADFYCPKCSNQLELKSKNGIFIDTINDGAYATMIDRILSLNNPDFLFMTYTKSDWTVKNLFFVPKHFFTPQVIKERKPLSQNARRAGWVGCSILLNTIPETGKIPIIENGREHDKEEILQRVSIANALQIRDMNARGWLFDVLSCVENINGTSFTLSEIYRFEDRLQILHPDNHNIKAKMRQQLQILRDRGIIEFVGRGKYRKLT